MNNLSDKDIIDSIKSADKRRNDIAFHALYDMGLNMVHNYVIKNNGNKQEADDIFQDGIIVIYNQVKKEDFKLSCKLTTYLFSICRNLWLKRLRKLSREIEVPEDTFEIVDIHENVLDTIDSNDQKDEVAKYLGQLSEGCRKIILLYYFERLRMNAIAKIMDLSGAQVAKNKKSGCMKKLKEMMASSTLLKNRNNN